MCLYCDCIKHTIILHRNHKLYNLPFELDNSFILNWTCPLKGLTVFVSSVNIIWWRFPWAVFWGKTSEAITKTGSISFSVLSTVASPLLWQSLANDFSEPPGQGTMFSVSPINERGKKEQQTGTIKSEQKQLGPLLFLVFTVCVFCSVSSEWEKITPYSKETSRDLNFICCMEYIKTALRNHHSSHPVVFQGCALIPNPFCTDGFQLHRSKVGKISLRTWLGPHKTTSDPTNGNPRWIFDVEPRDAG